MNPRKMNRLIKFTAAAFIFPAASAISDSLSLSTGLGYDGNPFQLNDALYQVDSEMFLESEISGNKRLGNWRIKGELTDRYYSQDSRADSLRVDADVRYRAQFGKANRLYLGLEFDSYDETYVSRFTGETYVFRGNNAGDRYDYQRWTPTLDFTRTLGKKHRFRAELDYRFQSYENYTDIGLSNLDYEQLKSRFSWRYRPAKGWELTPYIDFTQREYDDREAKDLSGTDIPGSNLEYDSRTLGLRLRRDFTDTVYLSASLYNSVREDNASGYFDYDSTYASLRLTHKPSEHKFGFFSVTYSDLDYDRQVPPDEADDIVPSRTAWRYRLQYQWPLVEVSGGMLALSLSATYDDYDSDDLRYTYDRSTAILGLNYSF